MSIFNELTTSLKATLYERTISPLSGAFVGAWAIFNWKAIAVFIWGQGDISSRILFIESHYVEAWTNLYYPVMWAVTFVLVYPFVALGPYALWEKISGWKLQIKQRYENTIALPISQSIAVRKEMRDKEKEFLQSMESKDAKIAELQSLNDATSNELAKLKEVISGRGDAESQLVRLTERLSQAEMALNQVKQESEIKERKAREQTEFFHTRVVELEKELGERNPAVRTDEEKWEEEYKALLLTDETAKQKIHDVVGQVANPNTNYGAEINTWGLAKGLTSISGKVLGLTTKGQFFAAKAI